MRKIAFDAEGLIYTMVLNRLMEPKSELGVHNWSKSLYGIESPKDLNQWYRALDLLIEQKEVIEKDLFESQKDLFNQEIDVVLMDTTSLVFKKRRLIACFNHEESLKDRKKREEIIARLIIKLKTQGLKSLLIHKEYSKYLKIKADKPSLDEERIKAEELFDGKFVIETNTKLGFKEVILAYKDLWRVEAGFRTLKNELEMGPIYHYTERRIRAHIFITFLALVLKAAFRKALLDTDKSLSLSRVLEDIGKIKAVQITIKDTPVVLRTELEGDTHYAFKAVGLKIPPRILDNPHDIQESVVVRLS